MNRESTSLFAFSIAVLAIAVLTPGAALAAPEHQLILEIELEGKACKNTLVTVSAQSCDGDELAAELSSELNDKLGPALCEESAGSGAWQCFWTAPEGCTQVRERATLETGQECRHEGIQGQIYLPLHPWGFFFFNIL